MIKRRNLGSQVLFFVATLGLYAIYWYHVSSKEMVTYSNLDGNPDIWTMLFPLPIINLYALWRHSGAVTVLTNGRYSRGAIFIAWVTFPPIVWYVTQTELNARSSE